jgi:membrane protein DedA with SNARE-associated domain
MAFSDLWHMPRHVDIGARLNASTLTGLFVLIAACTTPIIVQRFFTVNPEIVGTIGIPAIIILGFLGSVTVVIPVPILSLIFAGATILNPVTMVLAAAASITAGMAVCYFMGKRGHHRAVRAAESSQQSLPKPIANLYSWSSENVATASFILAATPNPIFDYAGFIAGAGKLDVRRFLAGTFVGKIAQTSMIALLGHMVGERLANIF